MVYMTAVTEMTPCALLYFSLCIVYLCAKWFLAKMRSFVPQQLAKGDVKGGLCIAHVTQIIFHGKQYLRMQMSIPLW